MSDRSNTSPTGLYLTAAASVTLVVVARVLGPAGFYITEREWQTAITSWWMIHEPHGLLHALTPLMGPPWMIPFEFPIFQWLAAHSAVVPALSLEDAGRGLSMLCFLLGVGVLYRLALDLDLDRRVAEAAAILIVSSPLYLAYGFSFTIESLALLPALLSLWFFVRWLLKPGLVVLTAATAAGAAAALTKVTTWGVFAAAIGVLAAWSILSARRHERSIGDNLIATAFILGVPLACTLWWTDISDGLKATNPLTAELTSSLLRTWTLGTIGDRLSAYRWFGFSLRSGLLVFGPIGLLVLGPAILTLFRSRRSRPPSPVLLASVVALATGPLVFTNLYFVHDYYVLAVGVFAALLFASALFTRRERPVLITLLIVTNLGAAAIFIAAKQANYEDPLSDGLARAVTDLPAGRPIVVFGSYLDARVPYQTHRKALQTRKTGPSDPDLREVVDRMIPEHPVAVMTRASAFLPVAERTARRLNLTARIELAPGVSIWTEPALKSAVDGTPIDLEDEVERRLAGFPRSSSPGRWGLIRPGGPDAAPGVGIVRGGNTYLFDIKRGFRVIHRRWAPPR